MDETIEMCKKAGVEEVYTHNLDVTDQDSIAKAIADVKEKYGSIDVLASNAGLNRPMPLDQVTPEVWDSVMNVNITWSILQWLRQWLQVMKAQGKDYHFTSSQAGLSCT